MRKDDDSLHFGSCLSPLSFAKDVVPLHEEIKTGVSSRRPGSKRLGWSGGGIENELSKSDAQITASAGFVC
jgi:hypothetical protein